MKNAKNITKSTVKVKSINDSTDVNGVKLKELLHTSGLKDTDNVDIMIIWNDAYDKEI